MKTFIAAICFTIAIWCATQVFSAEPTPKIELIFTCSMYAGDNIKPAKGYEIVEVRAHRSRDSSITICMPSYPFGGYEPTRESPSAVEVVMRRSATPGERIEPPKGCTIEVKP